MAQFLGRRATTEAYSTSTENLDDDPQSSSSSGQGQQLPQRTVPRRASQKLRDEEQGHGHGPGPGPEQGEHFDHARVPPNKLSRPQNPRKYTTSLEPLKLEIAQTRSYPDRDPYPESDKERQEMVILTLRKEEAKEKSDDDFRDIRWIHLQAEADINRMSFDDLKTATDGVLRLHDDELALALKMFKKIELANGKPFAHGRYGKYLVPTVFRDTASNLHLQPGEQPKSAIFFSLPYFDLRPLRKLDTVDRNANIYPIRTLLQSHYRLASTEERDKKQAVRKLDHLKNDKVISLPELWCLMVNKHTIITYAPVPIAGANGLFGRTIKTERASEGPTHVRYRRPGGRTHYFLVAQCKTWTQLRQTIKLAHDENIDYELKDKDGMIVSESNWSEKISQETSLYMDISVDSDISDYRSDTSDYSDYHSDSSDFTDSLTDDGTELGYNCVEIIPGADIVEVRPDPHSQIIDDLVRKMHLADFEARIARPRSISPVRRAETIGLSPSTKQFQDFGFEARSDSPEPLPFRRSVTINFTAPAHDDSESKIPMTPPPQPNRRQSASSDIAPDAPTASASPTKIPGVKTLYDSEDASYPYRSGRKDFRSRPSRRIGDPNHESLRGQRYGRDRFSPGMARRHSGAAPRMSRPGPMTEDEEIGPLAEPTAARDIGRGGNPIRKHHGGRRGRGNFTRLERSHDSSGSVNSGPNHIFKWPTSQHHPSTDSRIQDEMSPREPTSPANIRLNGIGDQTAQTEKAPGTYLLPRPKDSEQDDDALVRILDDAHSELAGQGKTKESHCYKNIEGRTLEEVEKELKRLRGIEPVNLAEVQMLECKLDIVVVAKKLYEAFVPVDHPCSIREKYWGGVYLLLKDSNRQWVAKYPLVNADGEAIEVQSELPFILKRTAEFLNMIEYIINGLSPSNDEQQKLRYRIPRALFKAFTHIVMFYVLHGLARLEKDPIYGRELYVAGNICIDRCNDLLTEGLHQLLVILHTDEDGAIVSYEPLESETIMALVMENLLDNPLRADAGETEISEVYSEYISELEIRAQEYASVEVFGEIKLLSEELDIVERTLSKQLQVMLDYTEKVDVATDDNTSDMQTYSAKLRKRVLDRSIKSLDQKIDDFRELKYRANHMQFSARQSISVRAESNEKAILIFTVVTVIFLPLSFVSGYLGMNVEDIRNMGKKQDLFWIIATPITVVIAGAVVLLIMGPSVKKRYLKKKLQ